MLFPNEMKVMIPHDLNQHAEALVGEILYKSLFDSISLREIHPGIFPTRPKAPGFPRACLLGACKRKCHPE
jgi:hypothetical protein